MINFLATDFEHLPMIQEWIAADEWHQNQPADFWLTGNECFVAFRLEDREGIVFFVRFDTEGKYLRLHTQFGPVDQVSQRRVAAAITNAMEKFIPVAKEREFVGIVYESTSPGLILFMHKMGFAKIEATNDYRLDFVNEAAA